MPLVIYDFGNASWIVSYKAKITLCHGRAWVFQYEDGYIIELLDRVYQNNLKYSLYVFSIAK
jgi:hypothetical protein